MSPVVQTDVALVSGTKRGSLPTRGTLSIGIEMTATAIQALLAGGLFSMLGWVISEQRALRRDVRCDFAGLRERMARLEGLFEGFTQREAVQ